MQRDPRFEALLQNLKNNPSKPAGLLQKIGAIAATIVIFGLALTFSVMLFAVVLAVGGVILGYAWWKTRDLRKVMREAQAQARARGPAPRGATPGEGIVLEGEVVREVREEPRERPRD
ncbi:CPBP family intramembrane glutamic endopeptidase [Aromatoleum diolicum]|uniref:CPBP family intramembrane metalloprotease n=1 Tax=Aromatoleum diolicum TaxID=75796 RepID=A0ABX1Q8J1_9RHOO|nr:CPBP family intramembrane glutamic endopeptidase [Aromatoleum diolicum]NMG74689.1 CPBP family intramembrane metalloprotease [Aromatoleum diolicum]